MFWDSIRRRGLPRMAALTAACLLLSCTASAVYIPTGRDTRPDPEPAVQAVFVTDGYEKLARIGTLTYYWREDRDCFMIVDERNGYTWKTGLDVPFEADVKAAVEAAETAEAKLAAAVPLEGKLNDSYKGIANSLISVEYYDNALNLQTASSAAQKDASSTLMRITDDHFRLDIEWAAMDLRLSAHVYLGETGLRLEVPDESIDGTGASRLAGLMMMPYLGASGGLELLYDPQTGKWSEQRPKDMIPGYVLVPDGSGALIRFRDNTAVMNRYVGSVYGVNHAEQTAYTIAAEDAVPRKEPLMPVFGIAHGQRQAAFVAWSESGDEHLELHVLPEESRSQYTYAYPRFNYNNVIHQVYNRKGDGYYRLFETRNRFTASMTYRFLAGDGSEDGLPADYVGMALAYRRHLTETGGLIERGLPEHTPLRVDFVMSDIKKGVMGHQNVVTTTAGQAGDILRTLSDDGIPGISSGLLGFQRGGITGGKPWTVRTTPAIGTEGDFKSLFAGMDALGVDVSFAQDYVRINSLQTRLASSQAYHRNGWGLRRLYPYQELTFLPVSEGGYARPSKAAQWLRQQTDIAADWGASSATVLGLSCVLTGHHPQGQSGITAAEAVSLYQNALSELTLPVNAETPNAYLWPYVTRFLQAPVMNTQYIIETDTVPFLQLVLQGSMELYAPYANFSFYTREDILRMIDYNTAPSFVLTQEASYLLASTNSLGYYSTEFSLYREIIGDVYRQVSETLDQVTGLRWTDRTVLAPGVIENRYDDGTVVLINYTAEPFDYGGQTVPAQSADVRAGEEGARS